MAGFTIKFDFLKDFDTIINPALAAKIGKMFTEESKRLIASGQSPVRGLGKFVAYKDPDKYPGKLKPSKPVNLSLTGEMLSHLGYKVSGKNKMEYGLMGMDTDVRNRAETHQQGKHPHVPRRQFIPEKGQEFVASIAVKMRKLFRQRVSELISKQK